MTRAPFIMLSLFSVSLALTGAGQGRADDRTPPLPERALAVLKQHCYRCHGQDGALEGGMSYILDREKLVARHKVIPGDARQSLLYKRVVGGKMPPPDVKVRPTEADIAVLREWIDAGAAGAAPVAARHVLTDADVYAIIRDDLEQIDRRSRRFTRYFSLAHLYNQGQNADELQTYRNAVAKVMNSLSWHPRITVPKAIDPNGVVLRIDLREFMWDALLWNRLVGDYPYAVLYDNAVARACVVNAAARVPVVRADWFVATASRPPLYYDLLQMPTNAAELERLLRVDVALNIQQERVMRTGFNGSGISKNNRVLERHDAVHGAYWRTYDFDAIPQNLAERDLLLPDRRNIFAYPLGPGGTENTFQHAGGEIIFNLPNGLHGYLLVNANNVRIDKGPIAIVSDPKRPDRAVEPGVSCMSCHLTGILQKSDQIRAHVGKNPKAFSKNDAEIVRALYPPEDKMRKQMDEDAERFRLALEKTGNKIRSFEPVSTLTLRYEADVDLQIVAAEMGVSPQEFLDRVVKNEAVARNLGGLKVSGGTVPRQVVVQAFGDLVRAMRIGSLPQAGASGQGLPDNTGEVDPLEGETNQVNSVVFSLDGRRALLASADRSVRLWDVEGGRDVRRFVGHRGSVWSVAFSRDGRFGLSGGSDRILRMWNIEEGGEVREFEGHEGLVLCIAFAPDGKRALSAALDHSIILWDVETGKPIRRLDGVAKFVNAVAFAPDGKQALIAGDSVIHLVDLSDGKELRTFEGHTASVTSLAFSVDGSQILSGADDGTVRLWDAAAGRIMRSFVGHAAPVKSVAFSPDGKQILSAGSDATVRLWDASGNELKKFSKHSATVLAAVFTSDGRATLSASNDADVRVWQLIKGKPVVNDTPPTGTQPPATADLKELRPARVIPTKGTLGNLFLSPNGRWLMFLNRDDARLGRIDTQELRATSDLAVDPGTDVLTMTPDGSTLVAVGAGQGGRNSRVQLFDAKKWAHKKTITIAATPYDVAADDQGRVFLTGGSGEYTEITVVDTKRDALAARWAGVWRRSFVRLSADQRKLYVATQGVSPGNIEAWTIPSRLDEKPSVVGSPAKTQHDLTGDFLITPDGRFVISKTGVVLHSATGPENDLKYETTIEPFLAAAIDADAQVAFLCGRDGTLRQYSYPDFKLQAAYRLPGVGYQAACDAKQGRLYIAVFDPRSLTARPGERSGGELYVFDIRPLIARTAQGGKAEK